MSTELSKEKLQALAYTDELTRLHNLRYMREYLPQYLDTAKEDKQNAALFVCDMDDFKLINDKHGHLIGDEALVHFTKIIQEKTKNKGMAMRYAGDEFVLLIPRKAFSYTPNYFYTGYNPCQVKRGDGPRYLTYSKSFNTFLSPKKLLRRMILALKLAL